MQKPSKNYQTPPSYKLTTGNPFSNRSEPYANINKSTSGNLLPNRLQLCFNIAFNQSLSYAYFCPLGLIFAIIAIMYSVFDVETCAWITINHQLAGLALLLRRITPNYMKSRLGCSMSTFVQDRCVGTHFERGKILLSFGS